MIRCVHTSFICILTVTGWLAPVVSVSLREPGISAPGSAVLTLPENQRLVVRRNHTTTDENALMRMLVWRQPLFHGRPTAVVIAGRK